VAADDAHWDTASHCPRHSCAIISAVQVDADLLRLAKVEPAREVGWRAAGLKHDIDEAISRSRYRQLIVGIGSVDVGHPPQLPVVSICRAAQSVATGFVDRGERARSARVLGRHRCYGII